MSEITQLNVHVPQQLVDLVEALGDEHGWSKRETISRAVTTLNDIMRSHRDAAQRDAGDEHRALFLRLAEEMPANLLQPRRDMQIGHLADGQPIFEIDGWTYLHDKGTDALLRVREEDAGLTVERLVAGRSHPVTHWSPDAATTKAFK